MSRDARPAVVRKEGRMSDATRTPGGQRVAHGGRTADALTVALAATQMAAALPGLLMPSLYRDNLLVASGWRGNDAVTLLVAVPLLVGARWRSRRGSLRSQLVWLGLVDYALYNCLFYLFGSAFNAAFLLYAATASLAAWALGAGLVSMVTDGHLPRLAMARQPARAIASFLLLLAAGLSVVHVGPALLFLGTGQPPAVVRAVGHPTNVIAALDLWLVVSWCVPAAWWLWRGRAWGVVLAAVITVKGAVYMAALSAATVAALRAGAAVESAQLAVWAGIGLGCLVAAVTLLRGVGRGVAASCG
jgi:hypothetical protein